MTFQEWLDQVPDKPNSEELAHEFWFASFKMTDAPARQLRFLAAKYLDARDEFIKGLVQLRGKSPAAHQAADQGKP